MRVTAETKSATRQRILEASRKLFAAEGFAGATTRDIARAAGIAVGTLFNYFPTKEAVVQALVSEAHAAAGEAFESERDNDGAEPLTLVEELFAYAAAVLRKLKPFRKYVTAAIEAELTPLAQRDDPPRSLQAAHLEMVGQVIARHGLGDAFTPLAANLYWTLFVGVLAFWSQDASPKQEDTLALIDQSLVMFCGWLAMQKPQQIDPPFAEN